MDAFQCVHTKFTPTPESAKSGSKEAELMKIKKFQ